MVLVIREFTGDTDINIEQIVEKLKTLPFEKQQEVLDFVKFLQAKMLQEEVKSQDQESPASVLTLAQKYIVSPALGEKENG